MSSFKRYFSWEGIIDLGVLTAIILFFFSFFDPRLIFSKSITTGGDTASHYYAAVYLKEYLLPNGRLIGWVHGNYAGFPMFQFYFPLPFIFMALLNTLISMEVAFKIVSILGTFLIPIFTYMALRLMRYSFPIPIFGSLGTLPFLFMEANSMWGGNIPSTLAGEFAYSQGLAFMILFTGTLYHGIQTRRWVALNGIIVALIGFSHGYTILFAGFYSLFFLISTKQFLKNFIYLFKIHSLGFLLMGLWIIPLIFNLGNTTAYSHVWFMNSIMEVFPIILLPLIAVALLGRVYDSGWTLIRLYRNPSKPGFFSMANLKYGLEGSDPRIFYLWFVVLLGGLFYLIGPKLHVVDIRFLPFMQLFLMIIGGVELGRVLTKLKGRILFPVILAILVFVWTDSRSKSIAYWIEWNYSGFEGKPVWPNFSALNNYLSGSFKDPRVVYEHSGSHNEFGTLRAFELLPLFSGRSTLEGLYMQGSLSTPFVFYVQSETSRDISCPLSDYGCSSLNFENGIKHFKMFNVRDYIARSDAVKNELKKHPEFVFKRRFEQLEVYELVSNENRYVSPLKYEPVWSETSDWKTESYKWFMKTELSDIHLVFNPERTENGDPGQVRLMVQEGEFDQIPRIPIPGECVVSEELKEEEIRIHTDCIDRPLLIKISYHPNWQVEGADRVYLASPSFMLIYPKEEEIVLRYAQTGVETVGNIFSIVGLIFLGLSLPFTPFRPLGRGLNSMGDRFFGNLNSVLFKIPVVDTLGQFLSRYRLGVLLSTLGGIGVVLIMFVVSGKSTDSKSLFTEGLRHLNTEQYDDARKAFEKIIREYPITGSANDAAYYSGITHFREADYDQALIKFKRLIRDYPNSNWVPEVYYHIGLSYQNLGKNEKARKVYQLLLEKHTASNWSTHAKARILEFKGTHAASVNDEDTLYAKAMVFFDDGSFEKAREFFGKLSLGFPDSHLAELSKYFFAICFFKENNSTATIEWFEEFIEIYPNSDLVPEAYYHIGLSNENLDYLNNAKAIYRKIVKEYPETRWAEYSKEQIQKLPF